MNNPFTFYSSFLYSYPTLFCMLRRPILFSLFIPLSILSVISPLNHNRPYCQDPHYDFIDIIDRFILYWVISMFIYHFYDNFMLWFAIIYTAFSYFCIIPSISNIRQKCLFHSSFHIVTSIVMIHLINYLQ